MKYKILGKSGLRVSELCLGTMTFGDDWGWGASREESKKMFDLFAEQGGNFIDTASSYTNGSSESFIGDFTKAHRDKFVIGTKYTHFNDIDNVNSSGNHRKSLIISVEQSLKRLKTDYIDLLWMHCWDMVTPIEEWLNALNSLITSGKVLYIGISDTPAWVIAKSQAMTELLKWNSFIGVQLEYNLLQRTSERELIPMAHEFGMTIIAWGPLAAGVLTGKYENAENGRVKIATELYGKLLNDDNKRIVRLVLDIASEKDALPSQVALKWVQSKNILPIIGARTVGQLHDNISATEINLTVSEIARLDQVSRIELGFPHDFLASDTLKHLMYGGHSFDSY